MKEDFSGGGRKEIEKHVVLTENTVQTSFCLKVRSLDSKYKEVLRKTG